MARSRRSPPPTRSRSQNINVINARGIAYSYKGDDERALADYDLCLQLRPTYGSAYNNRGLIFMRRGELQRALDEFNLAVKHISNDQSRLPASLQPRPGGELAQAV